MVASRISEDTDAKKAVIFVALMVVLGTVFALSQPSAHQGSQGSSNPPGTAQQ